MNDIFSFVTLAGVVAIAIIMWINMQHQSASLKATARACEDMNTVLVKNRRDAHKQLPFEKTALEWLASQIEAEHKLIEVISKSQKPAWVNIRCSDGSRLVVSPLSPVDLKSALSSKKTKSKLEQFEEPLLGTNKRLLSVKERSLRDNEWFDIEAGEIAKQLEMGWSEASKLYFYTVTPEVKRESKFVTTFRGMFSKLQKATK